MVESGRRRRRLRGALDAIVGKALRKESSLRYVSAAELAADLTDQLAGAATVDEGTEIGYQRGGGPKMRRARPLAATLVATTLAACSSPFAVVEVDPQAVYSADVAAGGEEAAVLSDAARRALRIQNLDELWTSYPELAVRALARIAGESDDPSLVAALAEMAWLEALRLDAARSDAAAGYYLVATAHAYEYLMAPAAEMTRAFDPRFDDMAEVYRKAGGAYVRAALAESEGRFRDHFREVLSETYRVRVERGRGGLDPDRFDELLPADALDVRGFRNRHRQPGLGIPLVAVRENRRTSPVEAYFPPEGSFYPATAVLRFGSDGSPPPDEHALFDDFVAREGQRNAVVSLYDPLLLPAVEIGGTSVPLAADLTAPYALLMERAKLRQLATQGLLNAEQTYDHQGIFMIEPYDPAKIPVLMIHGLRSSAHAWAELTNDLMGDPELRRAFQVWHYIYPSALPYLYSGSVLRERLEELRSLFDPQGDHEAMRSMVVVAHSMGGLMAKTLVSTSGTKLWDEVVTVPPEEVAGSPRHVERFRKTMIFEPLPWVERVVFISTPHRGSRMADAFVGRLGSALVNLPDDFKATFERFAEANWEHIRPESRKMLARGGPTSIRALSPRHQLLRLLAEIPIDSRVRAHTIIGDRDSVTGDPELDSDGVVTHESAHLEEAVSEITVPSRHDAYEHPLTLLEVKRILREHLRERGRG